MALKAHYRLDGAAAGSGDQFANGRGLICCGQTGVSASAPDSAPLSITGDIDIRVKLGRGIQQNAANQTLVAKWNQTGNQRSYGDVDPVI